MTSVTDLCSLPVLEAGSLRSVCQLGQLLGEEPLPGLQMPSFSLVFTWPSFIGAQREGEQLSLPLLTSPLILLD